MKYVYRLKIIRGRFVVVDILYHSEQDAENHADVYRESEYIYTVSVKREEVY